ncbi:MAG: response regulator, partial [Bacteroidota bacterium]
MENVNVLFVEDEPALAMIVKDSLEIRGFNVTHCEDAETAMKAFYKSKPDILVLDVMLPGKDGFTLARELRTGDRHTPIIFLTARAATDDVVKGFETGGNDYL